MDPRQLFFDNRFTDFCFFCGKSSPSTRDHIPSKVLLNDPLPQNLAVVHSCDFCNNSFSLDEEYVACFVEVVRVGSATPSALHRSKVRRILGAKPLLSNLIAESSRGSLKNIKIWEPDIARFSNVVLKLARGHLAYMYSELHLEKPNLLNIFALSSLSTLERNEFESIEEDDFLPEIGTRKFMESFEQFGNNETPKYWNIVQDGQYRFTTAVGDEAKVKIVLCELVGIEVVWK